MELYNIARKFRNQLYSQPPPSSRNDNIEVNIAPTDYTPSIISWDSGIPTPSMSSWVTEMPVPCTKSSNSNFPETGFNKTNSEFKPMVFTPSTSSTSCTSSQPYFYYPTIKSSPSIEDLADLFEYLDAREALALASNPRFPDPAENVTKITVKRVERVYNSTDKAMGGRKRERELVWLPAGQYQSPDGFVIGAVSEVVEPELGKTREEMENELGVRL